MLGSIKVKCGLQMLCVGVLALFVTLPGVSKGAQETPVPIRIGWQIPAAMQALITQV